jgi:hypothetical protein
MYRWLIVIAAAATGCGDGGGAVDGHRPVNGCTGESTLAPSRAHEMPHAQHYSGRKIASLSRPGVGGAGAGRSR